MVAALVHGQRVIGYLGISTPAGLVINDEERSLVLEAAGDLGFALHTIEGYDQRRQVQERVRVSFENASIGKA